MNQEVRELREARQKRREADAAAKEPELQKLLAVDNKIAAIVVNDIQAKALAKAVMMVENVIGPITPGKSVGGAKSSKVVESSASQPAVAPATTAPWASPT